MRFIHTADLYIDSRVRGLSRYEGAPLDRLRGATRRALERVVDLVIDEWIDFLLIAGELYDRDRQDFHTGLFVREQMARLGRTAFPDAVPGCFNIGLLHTSLAGGDGHDSYAPTTLSVIKSSGYDYWALGHVHARQVVWEVPRVVFPGNSQGRHARETGVKGCELVTVEGGMPQARFMPLDVVRWRQLRIEAGPPRRT